MSIEHKNITESNLHEVKGASTATVGQILQANGSGSTSFVSVNNLGKMVVSLYFPDLSTVSSVYVVLPIAGTLTKIYSIVYGSVDSTTVLSTSINGTSVTDGTITISSSSPEATVGLATPTANNTFTSGQYIKVTSDGGATVSVSGTITLYFEV